ncbi:integrase arm-type DNA-binding domain-containing protein [Defluviimonas sp. WL0050]|uniref:Integrase arm-type DNA-binding domain-containing protein n=1 Tax=Albidovulum litorale TaxID=2984134 RepID=A0ABT2ZQ42_9RHOB|nr:integrase arm-type DNA-binding domain-containing protein [Defluviimonas sp. WL0050]MCV2873275.1 integrase arm-type DNA-binding domain-containing protein [Defluviimonas sp. WL0050]
MVDDAESRKQGKHPEKALSDAFVRTVAEPGKYFDGHGLFLKVDATGARRWVQRIVIRGKRSELGLGAFPLVSLKEAREAAFANRKLARSGGDPLADKKREKAVLTFEEAARKVHKLHEPSWRNKKHAAQFISTLETYAFPRMGRTKVSDVSSADVLAVLTPIWLKKAETARRVRQRIGMVMKWAVAQGWRSDNPADAISQALPKQDKTKQHRKALHYNEVAGCIVAVKASGADPSTKLALEFLILTATRSGETRGALWEEIGLDAGSWTIPASRMKAKRDHVVPLSARALEILQAAKNLSDGTGLVFPGTKHGKPLSDMTLSKLVKELGFDADVHGFRTSFRTWAQERTNYPREVAEAALAHTIKDTAEAAYARSNLFDKRRKMMEAWALHIEDSAISRRVPRIS